jgi:hypothetical protein
MMKTIASLLLCAVAAIAIDKMPPGGVLGSRLRYPQRGLIGAYAASEGSGTTLTDASPSLGYRAGGTNTARCGNLTINNSGGTLPFAWNPAPYSLSSRPLRTGNALTEPGFYLGGTYRATRVYTRSGERLHQRRLVLDGSQDGHLHYQSADGTMPRALPRSGSAGTWHPLFGGDQSDDPIGFQVSQFSAPLWKDSTWGATSGGLNWNRYQDDTGGKRSIECHGDDIVVALVRDTGGLRMFCNGVEVSYKTSLSTMSRIFPGTVGYIGRDDTHVGTGTWDNQFYNQPLGKTLQFVGFHSVALTAQEVKQATAALQFRQRSYARQKPVMIAIGGDSINDDCYGAVGSSAGQCISFVSPNGTTLAGAMDTTQTSISFTTPGGNIGVIAYDASISTGGYIWVDKSEFMKITSCATSVGATSCTVQRGCTAGVCSGTGSSHSSGAYVQYGWAAQLRAVLNASAYIVNGAISFFDVAAMHTNGMEQAYRFYDGSNVLAKVDLAVSGIYKRRIMIGGECINSTGSMTAAQIETHHAQWSQDHARAGWEVILTTCTPQGGSMPSTSGGAAPDGKEAIRTSVNSWLRSNYREASVTISSTTYAGPNAVGLVDFDTDSVLNPDHCESVQNNISNLPPCAAVSSSTIPFKDNVSHLTSAGNYRMMLLVKAALAARGIN